MEQYVECEAGVACANCQYNAVCYDPCDGCEGCDPENWLCATCEHNTRSEEVVDDCELCSCEVWRGTSAYVAEYPYGSGLAREQARRQHNEEFHA